MARRLGEFEEDIERNNYIEAVAGRYHVGYEELRKLVVRTAVQNGLAQPVKRPEKPAKEKKEDGILTSQKILLTWMIEDRQVFHQISSYIIPEDFTGEIYRKVAELLYQQYEEGEANPARILDHFTEEEEHREAASLFHTKIRELTTPEEREKALKETVVRVKAHSIGEAAARLDPTDIRGLQRLMEAKRQLQDLEKLHISIN